MHQQPPARSPLALALAPVRPLALCRLVRKAREAESRWPSAAGSEAAERGRTSSEGAEHADLPTRGARPTRSPPACSAEARAAPQERSEYQDMISELQLLARDCDVALSAWEAADALYEQRKATMEAELKAGELQAAMLTMILQQDRECRRAELLRDAEKVWGPDHASRPPLATYNLVGVPLAGPRPPSPPPSPPGDEPHTPPDDSSPAPPPQPPSSPPPPPKPHPLPSNPGPSSQDARPRSDDQRVRG